MHNSCLDMVKGMVKGRQKVKRKLRKERKDDPPYRIQLLGVGEYYITGIT